MEYIGSLIDSLISNFDFAFMLIVNVLSFYFIKLIDKINGDKGVERFHKRIISVLATILLIGIYVVIAKYENIVVLINSAILAPISWNFVIKPVLKVLGIDYSKVQSNIE